MGEFSRWTYEVTSELPKEGETYYAESWNRRNRSEVLRLLVLAENEDRARRIVYTQTANRLNILTREVFVDLESLTVEEWIAKGMYLIDRGQRLPDRITRFGGLRAYQDRRGPLWRPSSRYQ